MLARATGVRLRGLLLCGACLIGMSFAGTAGAEPVKILTFVEVRSNAAERCRKALREYESAAHRHAASLRVVALEEIARPERFALLEAAAQPDELQRTSEDRRALEERLTGLLTAPPDRRAHHELGDASLSRPDTRASAPLYVIAHLDIAPPERAKGESALRHLASEARRSQGNVLFEVWQQGDRANHFDLIAVWTDRVKFNEFGAGTTAREFRESVASVLGSPYDERLYRRID